MLATSGRPAGGLDGWVVESKLDGWRSIVTVDDDRLAVRTRRGRSIKECVAELEPLTAGPDLVLDGELIVGAGRLSVFYRLGSRLARKPREGSESVVFVAFDLLWLNGTDLTARAGPQPEQQRRLLPAGLRRALVGPHLRFSGRCAGAKVGRAGAAEIAGQASAGGRSGASAAGIATASHASLSTEPPSVTVRPSVMPWNQAA